MSQGSVMETGHNDADQSLPTPQQEQLSLSTIGYSNVAVLTEKMAAAVEERETAVEETEQTEETQDSNDDAAETTVLEQAGQAEQEKSLHVQSIESLESIESPVSSVSLASPVSPMSPVSPVSEEDDENDDDDDDEQQLELKKSSSISFDENNERPTHHLKEHDSLVTVRLSEPPALSIDTAAAEQSKDEPITPVPWSAQKTTMPTVDEDDETEDEDVNWDKLQRTEDHEVNASGNNKGTENTAMLLARLEQENTKIATNPKSVKVHGPEVQPQQQSPRRPRPPSMAQLRELVNGPTPPALRYSMLPPPPMTDLEFYAALVQDYHQTAARLPTLLANKVRKGIPPPLRGVVWQGMTGATRDADLAARFESYCMATSPYEGIIGKDLGRSFPGVEMFRDPDGDGQRMLGRVLKSYSLHDRRIGYCQGLAFLVGPLLMHMPDREAFCVLVKLMENYDLRSSYTPDLAGLHMRIYQFRGLLRSTLPELSSHLDDLQVDPAAYVSQWFLSFFAVTCPLPMLFRMFDVVFAEGAAETIMRVALSLMQKNQERLLGCAELEDAIQLLLSRGLWDCYHYNADEFVQDFLSLSSVVSRDRLALLEQAYREAQIANTNQTGCANVDRSSAIATAASRFLGRLWSSSSLSLSSPQTSTATTFPSSILSSNNNASSNTSNTSSSDPSAHPQSSPANASGSQSSGLSAPPLRPLSMLRRSASKQSLASTVNSMEATSASITTSSSTASTSSVSSTASSSSSVLSTASTEATSLSRDSAADPHASAKSTNSASHNVRAVSSVSSKQSENERYLNSQIEDLLTALSDLQRQHALLAEQLQQEREDRDEDRKAVHILLRSLREKTAEQPAEVSEAIDTEDDTTITNTKKQRADLSPEELQSLLQPVDARFGAEGEEPPPSSQSKAQLCEELVRVKEQLANELAKSRERTQREYELEQEASTMKDQLRDSHAHGRSLYQDKQRLERLIHDMRIRGRNDSTSDGAATSDTASEWFSRVSGNLMLSGSGGNGGLRELKLVRSRSTPAQPSGVLPLPGTSASKRSSSITVRTSNRSSSIFGGAAALEPELGGSSSSGTSPDQPQPDALVLELVQAKTAEAVARQEAEEIKQKLENLRKALGLSSADLTSILYTANASGGATVSGSVGSTAAAMAMALLGRATPDSHSGSAQASPAATPAAAPVASTGYGGFFGWRRS